MKNLCGRRHGHGTSINISSSLSCLSTHPSSLSSILSLTSLSHLPHLSYLLGHGAWGTPRIGIAPRGRRPMRRRAGGPWWRRLGARGLGGCGGGCQEPASWTGAVMTSWVRRPMPPRPEQGRQRCPGCSGQRARGLGVGAGGGGQEPASWEGAAAGAPAARTWVRARGSGGLGVVLLLQRVFGGKGRHGPTDPAA